MKSSHTLVERKSLLRERHQTRASWLDAVNIPTMEELPQAETADLEQAYQYQSTIDQEFDLQ